ncbi:MAG: lysyl oxidase family protein [Chloroflexota bacterium]|nr:lysyl oxidase family protein [Chloroflexota bacterium]
MSRSSHRAPGHLLFRRIRTVAVLIFLAVLIGTTSPPVLAGPPLYPDLVTMPPSGLYFEVSSSGRYLLRFDNTAANLGGRLEISVDSIGSKTIYQNVYDQNVGGNRVVRQQVHSDLIYHPQHNHFHFSGFAQYELLRRDSAGFYNVTARAGSKTSFCILDSIRVSGIGPTWPSYTSCGATFQGMSAGWGDTYIAALFDQWIDVGTAPLADGQYAIRSTADPDNRLMETNDFNNVGMRYFTIVNGRIADTVEPPLCKVQRASSGVATVDRTLDSTVGSVVQLSCSRFEAGEMVDIYWGSANTDPKDAVTATSSGTLTAYVQIPPSSLGVHYIIAKGRSSGKQAAAIVNTVASVTLTPDRGEVGSQATVNVYGFSDGEEVRIKFYKAGSVVSTTMVVDASGSGSGSIAFDVPAAPFGMHKVEAVGQQSGASATGSFVITPSIELLPGDAIPGENVGISMRGFAAGEKVTVTIGNQQIEVGQFEASHSGSVLASAAKFTVPDLEAGTHIVTATGSISGIPATGQLEVGSGGGSEDPAPTDTEVPTETATTPPTEAPTEEPTPVETTVPNASPVADAGEDQLVVDADGNGAEAVTLEGSASHDPDGDPVAAEWLLEGTPVSTDLTTDIELAVGVYTLTLAVTDSNGARSSDQVVFDVQAPRDPPAAPGTAPL